MPINQILKMDKYKKSKILQRNSSSEIDEENFIFSDGCCLFHDKNEIIDFIDVDDDDLIDS